jgi:dihydrofolate reductase
MKLILACDPKGGIGYKNQLPWTNINGDLARFKTLTTGQIIVMGRNTWNSLPKKPLPGRLNFVVSRKQLVLPFGAIPIPNLNHFHDFDNVWLIGGAQLVNSNWDAIHEVHLTKTLKEYTCDTFVDLLYLETHFTCSFNEFNGDHVYQIWKRK